MKFGTKSGTAAAVNFIMNESKANRAEDLRRTGTMEKKFGLIFNKSLANGAGGFDAVDFVIRCGKCC
jgi:hypothetical protein